jgi:hypothetical protein
MVVKLRGLGHPPLSLTALPFWAHQLIGSKTCCFRWTLGQHTLWVQLFHAGDWYMDGPGARQLPGPHMPQRTTLTVVNCRIGDDYIGRLVLRKCVLTEGSDESPALVVTDIECQRLHRFWRAGQFCESF